MAAQAMRQNEIERHVRFQFGSPEKSAFRTDSSSTMGHLRGQSDFTVFRLHKGPVAVTPSGLLISNISITSESPPAPTAFPAGNVDFFSIGWLTTKYDKECHFVLKNMVDHLYRRIDQFVHTSGLWNQMEAASLWKNMNEASERSEPPHGITVNAMLCENPFPCFKDLCQQDLIWYFRSNDSFNMSNRPKRPYVLLNQWTDLGTKWLSFVKIFGAWNDGILARAVPCSEQSTAFSKFPTAVRSSPTGMIFLCVSIPLFVKYLQAKHSGNNQDMEIFGPPHNRDIAVQVEIFECIIFHWNIANEAVGFAGPYGGEEASTESYHTTYPVQKTGKENIVVPATTLFQTIPEITDGIGKMHIKEPEQAPHGRDPSLTNIVDVLVPHQYPLMMPSALPLGRDNGKRGIGRERGQ